MWAPRFFAAIFTAYGMLIGACNPMSSLIFLPGAFDPGVNFKAVGSGAVCFASGWYDRLTELVGNFINATGLSMLETDGPYGGETCESTSHSHHHGKEDSVYWQTRLQAEFYEEMRRRNVFVNQPDDYFFTGGSKTGMGCKHAAARPSHPHITLPPFPLSLSHTQF